MTVKSEELDAIKYELDITKAEIEDVQVAMDQLIKFEKNKYDILSFLNKNKKLKKWVKMVRYMIGTNTVTNAATKATYKTVWVAGPSIEYTKEILPVKDIVAKLVN